MSMAYIRSAFGVPAKRGMAVKPKRGMHKGLLGYVRGSSAHMLVVADVRVGRAAWVSTLHPDDVDFLNQGEK